jgi:hypothetical protein
MQLRPLAWKVTAVTACADLTSAIGNACRQQAAIEVRWLVAGHTHAQQAGMYMHDRNSLQHTHNSSFMCNN